MVSRVASSLSAGSMHIQKYKLAYLQQGTSLTSGLLHRIQLLASLYAFWHRPFFKIPSGYPSNHVPGLCHMFTFPKQKCIGPQKYAGPEQPDKLVHTINLLKLSSLWFSSSLQTKTASAALTASSLCTQIGLSVSSRKVHRKERQC